MTTPAKASRGARAATSLPDRLFIGGSLATFVTLMGCVIYALQSGGF
jgi:hypothetical protein